MNEDFVLDIDLDISKAEAKTQKLNAEFEKQKQKVAEARSEYEKSLRALDSLNQRLKELEAMETKTAEEERKKSQYIQDQKIYIENQTAEVERQKNNYELQVAKLNEKGAAIKENVRKTNEEAAAQEEVKNRTEETAAAQNKTVTALDKLQKRVIGLAKRVFVFSVITRLFRAMREGISSFIKSDTQMSQVLAKIKGNLITIGVTLYQVIKPILQWILNVVQTITNSIARALAKILGKNVKDMAQIAESTQETAKAAEKAKKAFAGWDVVQTIDTTQDDVTDTANTIDTSQLQGDLQSSLDDIYNGLIVGAGLIVIGLILALSGVGVGIGITLMFLGALSMYSIISQNWGELPTEVQAKIMQYFMGIAIVLIVIGLILCLTGAGIGVGLVILLLGCGMYFAGRSQISGTELENQILPKLEALLYAGGTILVIIGIIVCCTGNVPLGVGIILAGAGLLGIADGEIKWDWLDSIESHVKDSIDSMKDYWDEWQDKVNNDIAKMESGDLFGGIIDYLVDVFDTYIARPINWTIGWLKGLWLWNWDDPEVKALMDGKSGFYLRQNKGGAGRSFSVTPSNSYTLSKIPVKYPRLATGAVIPGGSPFLAWLGDQPRGKTNIEAPLDTLVAAFKAAQPKQSFTITANGSMAQFLKMLNLQIKEEDNRSTVF